MENNIIIEPQNSFRRNESILAWVNRQAQIDAERIRSTEPKARRPLSEKFHPIRKLFSKGIGI